MGDLDETQERITLALYGGALAAIGVLLVAFLFYMQTALPLIRDLGATLSAPPAEEIVATDEAGNTTTIPAVTTTATDTTQETGADPSTHVRLIIAATALGGALVGWALAASVWRGVGAAILIHFALAGASFPLAAQLADPIWFLGCLLAIPCLTIIAALAAQSSAPLGRRALAALVIILCAPPTLLLILRIGWWIIPVAWIVLPIIAALALARGDTVLSE